MLAEACARVVAEHRHGRFAVLHGLWADEPGFVAVILARLLRIPAIVSVMGGELVDMPDIGYGGQLSVSNRLLSTVGLLGATRVTGGSTQATNLVRRTLRPARWPRVTELTWGIDPCVFEPGRPPRPLAGDSRVLHVGSLVPIKDQATLLRAIARVKETEPGVHLHLVGDGPLRPGLTDQAEKLGLASCVTFHGHVDRRELAAYFRAADVVAVSSRYEAQLVVALEAALCGVPIVGTAVGLVADLAPEAAIAVPIAGVASLAEAILTALQPERGRALGMAGSRLVASKYLAAHTAGRLLSIYQNPALLEAEA